MKPGAGELLCPECGQISAAHQLVAYGFSRAKVIQFAALLVGPALLLIVSSWGFAMISGQAVHVAFCLMFSPFAIAAHVYALHEFVQQGIVLTNSRKRLMKIATIIAAVFIDIAACVLVAKLFI